MSQYFPGETFQAMVEDRYDELRSDAWTTGHKGIVTHIKKGAAAIGAYARLRKDTFDIQISRVHEARYLFSRKVSNDVRWHSVE